jgi:hypothetical protein
LVRAAVQAQQGVKVIFKVLPLLVGLEETYVIRSQGTRAVGVVTEEKVNLLVA